MRDASSLTKDSLKGFITESPFSFKNPIFFSVPPKINSKKVDLLNSKRTLFPQQTMNFGQAEGLDTAGSNNFQQFVAEQAKAAKNVHVESQRKEQLFSLFNKGPEAQK